MWSAGASALHQVPVQRGGIDRHLRLCVAQLFVYHALHPVSPHSGCAKPHPLTAHGPLFPMSIVACPGLQGPF